MLLKSSIRWFYVWGGRGAPVAVGEGDIFHHSLPWMVPRLLRKETRGGGEAATSYCFVPVGHDQRTEPVWRLCARPLETFGPPLINSIRTKRRQVAAALSAAVTISKLIGDAPTIQAEPTSQKQPPQTLAALREGARGWGFSQRSRLPRNSHFRFFFATYSCWSACSMNSGMLVMPLW